METNKLFWTGLQANYDSLVTPRDGHSFYFCTDSRNLYLGDNLYTDGVRVVVSRPSDTTAAVGVLYINSTSGLGEVFDGTNWKTIIRPVVNTITGSTSSELVDASGIKSYVGTQIAGVTGGSGIVVDINAHDTDAGVIVADFGDGSDKEIELDGLAHDITYDPTALKLTIPMVGEELPLVINLPVDNFVESGVYDSDTESIVLTLKDKSTVSIPAVDLVDIYVSNSGSNDTVTIVVDPDLKAIKATIKVDTSGPLAIASDGKITIDLSAYVKAMDLSDAISTALALDVDEGEDLIDYVEKLISVESAALITNKITPLEERVLALETALTWGTF